MTTRLASMSNPASALTVRVARHGSQCQRTFQQALEKLVMPDWNASALDRGALSYAAHAEAQDLPVTSHTTQRCGGRPLRLVERRVRESPAMY